MTKLVTHLQRLPHQFFQYRTTGDILSRLSGVVELRGMSFRILGVFIEGLVVVCCTALMLAYDVRLGLLVLVLAVARIGLVAALQGSAAGASTRERVHRGHETAALVEALAVPELTRSRGVQRRLFERYTVHLRARLHAALERRRITEAGSQLTLVLDGLQHALLLWIGGTRTLAGEISLGVLVAFATLGALLQRPMEVLIVTLTQLGRATSILARMDDVLQTPPEPNGTLAPPLEGRVALERVTFRYGHEGRPILDELSLVVAPGESVAIVGASAAGKSTLAKLLVGLLEPTGGTVRIDGHDLRALDRAHLRRHCGVVLQDTFLLEDTVGANVALQNPALSLAELREAARLACVADVIDALPRGYETLLGPHGHRLSGGERQRLAIARALAIRPRLLILDEATSSLDLETEARVHANISALPCTRVIVAHRLATVRNVDRIIVLENGRIAQQGSYEELAGQPGLFREMVRTLEVAA